jgi:hypothetical protein
MDTGRAAGSICSVKPSNDFWHFCCAMAIAMRAQAIGRRRTFAGARGHAVGAWKVRGVALPPLNAFLAKDLIRSTGIPEMLDESSQQPLANLDALESVLLRVDESDFFRRQATACFQKKQ